jgi:hypothetical protein
MEVSEFDDEVHITNVCKNKHNANDFRHEMPCDIEQEYPMVYKNMAKVLRQLFAAASPFLKQQRSDKHFEYMGVDFLADDNNNAWLVECNCPPNNTGTQIECVESFHHGVWHEMIKTFAIGVVHGQSACVTGKDARGEQHGKWNEIASPAELPTNKTHDPSKLALNALSWAAFQSKEMKARRKR